MPFMAVSFQGGTLGASITPYASVTAGLGTASLTTSASHGLVPNDAIMLSNAATVGPASSNDSNVYWCQSGTSGSTIIVDKPTVASAAFSANPIVNQVYQSQRAVAPANQYSAADLNNFTSLTFLPMWWDPAYRNRYLSLMQALSNYIDNPASSPIANNIAEVHIGGTDTEYVEAFMLNIGSTGAINAVQQYNLNQLISHGYSEIARRYNLEQIIISMNNIFTHTRLSFFYENAGTDSLSDSSVFGSGSSLASIWSSNVAGITGASGLYPPGSPQYNNPTGSIWTGIGSTSNVYVFDSYYSSWIAGWIAQNFGSKIIAGPDNLGSKQGTTSTTGIPSTGTGTIVGLFYQYPMLGGQTTGTGAAWPGTATINITGARNSASGWLINGSLPTNPIAASVVTKYVPVNNNGIPSPGGVLLFNTLAFLSADATNPISAASMAQKYNWTSFNKTLQATGPVSLEISQYNWVDNVLNDYTSACAAPMTNYTSASTYAATDAPGTWSFLDTALRKNAAILLNNEQQVFSQKNMINYQGTNLYVSTV